MRVAYRQFRPVTLLYARGTGAYGSAAHDAWRTMESWLENNKAGQRVKVRYGIMHDNPATTEPGLLRYDACVQAMPGLELDPAAGIRRLILPGGAYAVHTHIGSYDRTGDLFTELCKEAVPKRGLALDTERPFFATYLNDPSITREMHRRTDICVPVIPLVMPVANNDDVEENGFSPALMTG